MKKTKYYTSEQIQLEYNKYSSGTQVGILYEALDYMQQYNGRTKFMCIAMAMGYENIEGLDNTYFKR